ncbi:MAG: hypothetical protein V4510_09765 [bacterium]
MTTKNAGARTIRAAVFCKTLWSEALAAAPTREPQDILVKRTVDLDQVSFNALWNNPGGNHWVLRGARGWNEYRAPNGDTMLINTEGYEYARYIAIPAPATEQPPQHAADPRADTHSAKLRPAPKDLTDTDLVIGGLEREIKTIERAILSGIESLGRRLADAEEAINAGRMPSACGIVQGLGNDLDMKVARLDQARSALASLKAAAAHDAKPAIKAASLCRACFKSRTADDIDGADAFFKNGVYHLMADGLAAVCGEEVR